MNTNIVNKTRDSIVTGLLFLIAGTAFFVLLGINKWSPSSILPHVILVLGITASIIGILKVFMRKSCFVSSSNHQKLKSFEIYFDVSETDKLARIYNNGKIDELLQLKPVKQGGLKISIMATKDLSLCFSQASKYVPFEFVPVTATKQHSVDEAQYLINLAK